MKNMTEFHVMCNYAFKKDSKGTSLIYSRYENFKVFIEISKSTWWNTEEYLVFRIKRFHGIFFIEISKSTWWNTEEYFVFRIKRFHGIFFFFCDY